MHNFVSKFLLPITISIIVGLIPLSGFCQACSSEGEPCGDGLGSCCPTYTNEAGECKKLTCAPPDHENAGTCIEDGVCE